MSSSMTIDRVHEQMNDLIKGAAGGVIWITDNF